MPPTFSRHEIAWLRGIGRLTSSFPSIALLPLSESGRERFAISKGLKDLWKRASVMDSGGHGSSRSYPGFGLGLYFMTAFNMPFKALGMYLRLNG